MGVILNYMKNNASGGAVYGIGIFGALIYFLQHAQNFQQVIWGIAQSIFWPAVLVYKALEFLKV